MQYVKVNILRDETAAVSVYVGAWEVPVLELKHSEERITLDGTVDRPNRPWPEDARSEMQRLSTLYGLKGSGDDAMSYAERVYGEGSMGVKRLAEAIEKAKLAAEGEKPKKARSQKAAALVG